MERLQKFLSAAGVASRRGSEKLIISGCVKVNGKIVKDMGVKVTNQDKIQVDGKYVKKITKKAYYLLNKPKGIITTVTDPKKRNTIMDFFNEKNIGLHPVGRLDRDSTGLLLVTNDGDLTNKLIHPSMHIGKKYFD